MSATRVLLTGMGLGAGLMYLLDPNQGERRRAALREQTTKMTQGAQEAVNIVREDMQDRWERVSSGDVSVLTGSDPANLLGNWSPTARTLLGALGGGLFFYGLTQSAPKACIVGTIGLALAVEGITNAKLEDIRRVSHDVQEFAGNIREKATGMADQLGLGSERQENGAGQGQQRPAEQRA